MSTPLPDDATECAFELEGVYEANYPNTELWAHLFPNADGSLTWAVYSGQGLACPLDYELPPREARTAGSVEATKELLYAWAQGEVMRGRLIDEATAARARREAWAQG